MIAPAGPPLPIYRNSNSRPYFTGERWQTVRLLNNLPNWTDKNNFDTRNKVVTRFTELNANIDGDLTNFLPNENERLTAIAHVFHDSPLALWRLVVVFSVKILINSVSNDISGG